MSAFLELLDLRKWELLQNLLQHINMTTIAVLISLLIGVPAGVLITRNKTAARIVIMLANIMQSIPCLALLAISVIFLGIGVKPAILMVFVYAFLPILKNTYTGIMSVDPKNIEFAQGVGLTKWKRLIKVELPIAVPFIMSGIRIAAVASVGTMTIAAFAGAKGLGWFINLGLNSLNMNLILLGAIPVSLLALFVDFAFGKLEEAITSEGLLPPAQIRNLSKEQKRKKKIVAGVLCSTFVIASLLYYPASNMSADGPFAGKNSAAQGAADGSGDADGAGASAGAAASGTGKSDPNKRIVVGSSNFTEVQIIGNIYKELIESNTDITVDTSFGLSGAAFCFSALERGDIDMFVEYTGTALTNLLAQPIDTDPDRVLETVTKLMQEEHGIHTSKPLGFNNTYVMSVKPETAEKYGLKTLSDLVKASPELRLGCTTEFMNREDCLPALEKLGAKFKSANPLDASVRYTAIDSDQVDVIDAFSTDALLYKQGLMTLTDDMSFFPPYYAVNFVSQETLDRYPELEPVLEMLDGKITEETMANLNSMVDVDGEDARVAAHSFLEENGLLGNQ